MKDYELTVLVNPDLEAEIDKPLARLAKIITDAGGKINKQDIWGKKRLAYAIDKHQFANYLYFEVALPAEAPLKISNLLNIEPPVLRYLLVKSEPIVAVEEKEEEK